MSKNMRDSFWFRALILSLLVNALASGVGMLADVSKPLRFLGYVAQAVAAPPAFFIGWLIRPQSSSLFAIISAGIVGLAFSIVFYAMIFWLILLLLHRSNQSGTN